MISMRLRCLVTGAMSLVLAAGTAATAAAQGGTLTGTVTAGNSGGPLQEARVIVVGTSLFTTTGPDGKYTLRRVPAGTADLRVIRVGYQEQKKSIQVVEGQTATLDFLMSQSVVQLQEVVTTATGEQRKAEIGNAVDNVPVPLQEPFAYVLREGVTNVIRHSGANRCEVRLGDSWIEIRDDGRPAPGSNGGPNGGHGLTGLA